MKRSINRSFVSISTLRGTDYSPEPIPFSNTILLLDSNVEFSEVDNGGLYVRLTHTWSSFTDVRRTRLYRVVVHLPCRDESDVAPVRVTVQGGWFVVLRVFISSHLPVPTLKSCVRDSRSDGHRSRTHAPRKRSPYESVENLVDGDKTVYSWFSWKGVNTTLLMHLIVYILRILSQTMSRSRHVHKRQY